MRKLSAIGFLLAALYFLSSAAAQTPDIDNQFVHVIRAEVQPHKRGALHRHEFNRVIVGLDAGELRTVYETGRTETQHFRAGSVVWAPAGGMHTSEGVSSRPFRLVEVELKKPAPLAASRNPKLDPVALDPKHNILLLDNPQVRVFRSWREPGGTEQMHEHAGSGRVAILLTAMDARVKLADGSESEQHAGAGDVVWSGPLVHAATNAGRTRLEMIIVEVK